MRKLRLILLALTIVGAASAKDKAPDHKSIPSLMSQIELLSNPESMVWNLDEAYLLSLRADSIYKVANDWQLKRLARKGFERKQVSASIKDIYRQAWMVCELQNDSSTYAHFASFYRRAPYRLRRTAIERHDSIVYACDTVRIANELAEAYKARQRDTLTFERLHRRYEQSPYYEDIRFCYTHYDYMGHDDWRKKDSLITEVSKGMGYCGQPYDTVAFICAAAPYRCAYRVLTWYLEDYLRQGNNEMAKARALIFADEFGDDRDYWELIRVLGEEPVLKDWPCIVRHAQTNGENYAPVVTADGETMYFCSMTYDWKRRWRGPLWVENIMVMHKKDGEWQAPELEKQLSVPDNHDFPLAISLDGTTFLTFRGGRLMISKKTPKGNWTAPKELDKKFRKFSKWICDVQLTADGRHMLFAAWTMGKDHLHYNENLYVCKKNEKGEWGKPIDLGPVVNSACDDRSPVLYPDMTTLYFTSNGHGTMGSFDVFRCKRLDMNSWTKWSEPENVGHYINGPGTDWKFQLGLDGKTCYLSCELAMPDHWRADNFYEITLPEHMRPNAIATLIGRVLNRKGLPVGAQIAWENLSTGERLGVSDVDPSNGKYIITLPMGYLYGYYVLSDTLFPTANFIDLRTQVEPVQREQDIQVVSIREMKQEGLSIPLPNLFFDVDKADLLPTSYPELRRIAAIIIREKRVVEISGHTDNTGTAEHNQKLSEERAEAVRRYLISKGCPAKLLRCVGYGATRPVAGNSTDDGRQKNRRVEFRFLK